MSLKERFDQTYRRATIQDLNIEGSLTMAVSLDETSPVIRRTCVRDDSLVIVACRGSSLGESLSRNSFIDNGGYVAGGKVVDRWFVMEAQARALVDEFHLEVHPSWRQTWTSAQEVAPAGMPPEGFTIAADPTIRTVDPLGRTTALAWRRFEVAGVEHWTFDCPEVTVRSPDVRWLKIAPPPPTPRLPLAQRVVRGLDAIDEMKSEISAIRGISALSPQLAQIHGYLVLKVQSMYPLTQSVLSQLKALGFKRVSYSHTVTETTYLGD